MDTTKRDLTLSYAGRTFAVRAYRAGGEAAGPQWQASILERRTPLRHDLAPTPTLAACFGAAIAFLVALAETAPATASAPLPFVDGDAAAAGAIGRDRDGRRGLPLAR